MRSSSRGWVSFDPRYLDLNGKPVERTRETHQYSYDAYVVWKKDYSNTDSCIYSDRLVQQDYDKYNSCCQQVWGNEGQYFNNREPEKIGEFLSLFLGKNVKMTAIMEGCNVSNGFPYWVFFFKAD